MALNNRLVQNIDLQGDAGVLQKALQSIGTALNEIVSSSGKLQENLNAGGKAGQVQFNAQLRAMRQLVSQATQLQNILEGTQSRRAARGTGLLNEQRYGRDAATIGKLSRDLSTTATAADALDKRLSNLRKRFADLREQGRTPTRRDLAKEFNIQGALEQTRALQKQIQNLNGRSLNTPMRGQSADMQKLRAEIERVNTELLNTAKNNRKTNFQPHIDQVRALTDQYRKLISAEIREAEVSSSRGIQAREKASQIIGMSDSQRLAQIKRAGSAFQFPTGVSNAVTQQQAETQLASSLNKRLRLVNMIEQAQARNAPLRSVERLNTAYTSLNQKLGEQFKLLQTINAEQARTPGTAAFRERGARSRAAIMEQLFGDGGVGFATRIAGASVITTGVFAVINAVQSATRFVVEYESALKQLQAISGSTDIQTRRLAEGIASVGAESKYSVLEITKAATVIAQAGFSAAETNEVLRSAMTLSTAAGIDPSQAVDTLTSVLGAFQLQATESTHTVNVMVAALNQSKLSIDQLQASIQYSAATANEAGISFEELAALSASLANAGIRSGSTIGTGLRQLLVDMQTPTDDFKKELGDLGLTLADVDVKALGFAQVVKNLSTAGFGAEQAYSAFETRAAAAFLALKGQIGTYDQLALSVATGANAADAQATAMDSLGSQWQKMLNILGTTAATIGQPVLDLLKGLLIGINAVLEPIQIMTTGFSHLTGSSTVATTAMRAFIGVLIGATMGPIGALVGGILGLVSGLNSAGSALDEMRTKTSDAAAAFQSQMETVRAVDDTIDDLIQKETVLRSSHSELQLTTVNLGNRFKDLQGELSRTGNSYEDLLAIMQRYSVEQRRVAGERAAGQQAAAQAQIIDTRRLLDDSRNPTMGVRARAQIRTSLPAAFGSQAGAQRADLMQALESNDASFVQRVLNTYTVANAKVNGGLGVLVGMLENRARLLSDLADAQQKSRQAGEQIRQAEITSGNTYVGYERSTQQINSDITTGLLANEQKAGTGDAALNSALNRIDSNIAQLKTLQNRFKAETQEWYAVGTLISNLNEQRGRVVRSRRIAAEEEADKPKPKISHTPSGNPTQDILDAQVYARSQGFRSSEFGAQSGHKGVGHRQSRAIDINIGTGNVEAGNRVQRARMDQLAKQYQEMGYIVLWNGVRYDPSGSTSPITGGDKHKDHMHVEAPPLGITVGGSGDSAIVQAYEQDQRDQTSLRNARAGYRVGGANSAIQNVLSDAKAGTDTPTNLVARLQKAMEEYRAASLSQFDTQHPTDKLTPAALEEARLAREELENKLTEDADKFTSDLQRSIGDYAKKVFDSTFEAITARLDNADYAAEGSIRAADRNEAVMGNSFNRGRASDGDNYFLQRQRAQAELRANQNKLAVRGRLGPDGQPVSGETLEAYNALQALREARPDVAEGSEAHQTYLQNVADAQQRYNDLLRETSQLMIDVDTATAGYVNRALPDRIRDGIGAWAEQSGVMDTYADTIAKNVVPALETVTGAFSTMFSNMLSGETTVRDAIGGMIQAIGEFVTQLIAKAMALAAVKWFLKLLGFQLVDDIGGVSVSRIVGQMTGGQAGKPAKLMTGGSANPYISSGVSNRDSVPALLAQDEFVMRGAAVKDIGLSTMHEINRFGAKALNKIGNTAPMIMPQGKQETNVYIIAPEEKPQLGENDIIATFSNDVLRGGVTKRLIKQVANG